MIDIPRHKENMHLPLDWPRINQFPEYFTAESGKTYTMTSEKSRKEKIIRGDELKNGLPVKVKPGKTIKIMIE